MKRRKLNTVAKKYAFGYILIGAVITAVVIFLFITEAYISSVTHKAIESLTTINELEQTVESLNNDVNISFVYLNADGVDQYQMRRQKADTALQASRQLLNAVYLREVADLNGTIETYLSQTDSLMGGLTEYLNHGSNHLMSALQEEYSSVQHMYAYISLRFQETYSIEVNRLNDLQSNLRRLKLLVVEVSAIVFVCAGVFCSIYAVHMTRSMASALSTLNTGVTSFEKDIANSKPIQLNSDDEFEILADAFNHMRTLIQIQMKSISENADTRERLVKAENENLRMYGDLQKNHLDFLQSRVNPHFLFNTLNTISAQAEIEGAEKTAELINTTAAFLRYNLDNISNAVILEKELSNLQDYIEIEKARYGRRYQFEVSADDIVLHQVMPCMILQPLVENALTHGISKKVSGGAVKVRAYMNGKRVILQVCDNGVGMNPTQIQELYQSLQGGNEVSKHIGVSNIYRRLKLFYSNDVKILIARLDPGLSIILSIPWMTENKAENNLQKETQI